MQLTRNNEQAIPFLDKLNLDKEKVIEAFLTPVNLAGFAASVYNSLSNSTDNSTDKKFLTEMAYLYQQVAESKEESTNKHGIIYSHTEQSSMLEFKAITSLMENMTKKEAEDFIEKHKIKSANSDNGVICQNNDYNIAQIASVIADKKFEGIHVLPFHTANDYSKTPNHYLTPLKLKTKFLVSLLENIDESTLENFKNTNLLKQKAIDESLKKQENEVNEDVKFLREKGHSILKEDVRSHVEFERLYRISKNNLAITDSIDITINRQKAVNLTKAIDNPELSEYVKDIRLSEYKYAQIADHIKSLYKRNDHELEHFMSNHVESHAPYQLASIIKKDKRRNDPELQESISDESFFEPKRRNRFGFGR